jgi:alpha-L-arabinofuranosidase
MVAQHLNSFIRHADIVKMANMTMLSNLVGHSPEGVYKNATFKAFWLYSNNCFGTSLDVSTSCENTAMKIFKEIPYLDVTAVLNNEAGNLVINVVNRHETKAIETDIILQTGEYTGNAKVNEVNGKIADPGNPRAEEAVNSTSSDIKFKGNIIKYTFPAHSFTQIMIPLK